MRKFSILALGISLILASCQKSFVTPSSNPVNASSKSDIIAASNFKLLTSHTWWYVKYYTNYTDPNNPGNLVYRRGRNHNQINLDLNRVTFNIDGTVDEIDQYGNSVPGTWHFTNAAQTQYVVTNAYGNHYTNIDNLTRVKFEWTDSGAKVHGVMVADNLFLLTAHTWEYVKYYTNYVDAINPGSLVYQRGGTNNTIDLDNERVTYHTDGTVTEIDQIKNTVPGTWQFTNSQEIQYQITNQYGTFLTNIDLLSSKNFEWTDPDTKVHGVMVPAD